MNRRTAFFMALAIMNFALLFSTQAMDAVFRSTEPDVRAKVFQGYYLDNPLNTDPSVFEHMRKWFEEDTRVLDQSLTDHSNKLKLANIGEVLRRSFAHQTVSFTQIALTYATYSLIASADEDPTRMEEAEHAIQITRNFIEHNDTSGNQAIFDKFSNIHLIHGRILMLEGDNLHWFPYVNELGLVTYRTLNDLYGMRAPTLGLPLRTFKKQSKMEPQKDATGLRTASYDGILKVTADAYLRHEVNHGGQSDPGIPGCVGPVYSYCEPINKIVRKISDPTRRLLCDIFYFELSHELSFVPQYVQNPRFVSPTQTPLERMTTLVFPQTFDEAFDRALARLEGRIITLSQAVPLDYQWKNVSVQTVNKDGSLIPFEQTREEYYDKSSKLKLVVNPATQKLYTLPELILEKKLPKDRELDIDEILGPLEYLFDRKFNPQDRAHNEFGIWVFSQLYPSGYNLLITLKAELNDHGIKFDIWNGDKFLKDEMIQFFRNMGDIFKQEVGPHIKWVHAPFE